MSETFSLHNSNMRNLFATNDATGKRIVTMTLPQDATLDDWRAMADAIRLFCASLGMVEYHDEAH